MLKSDQSHKIPWFDTPHYILSNSGDVKEYPPLANYINSVKTGIQPVSEDIHDLIEIIETYLYPMIDSGEIYMDLTMCEMMICVPAKYFPYGIFEWEAFLVPFICGFRFSDDDSLVFDEYFMYMARGAGKNGWLSWLIFGLISKVNGIPHYDVAVSASSERQAKRSFLDIHEVLTSVDPNKRAFKRTKTEIESIATKSNFQFLSSNGATADGLRLGALYLDEVHAIDSYDMLNVLKSALGKIPDPRTFITTTDGYTRGSVLDDYKDTGHQILKGELGFWYPPDNPRHSRILPFMHHIDDESEAKDLNGWHKSNPSLRFNKFLLQQYRKEVVQIDRNAELNIEFFAKRVNFPKQDSRFALATYDEIMATKNGMTLQEFSEQAGINEVIGCVDYADARDLASAGMLLIDEEETQYYFTQHSFITQPTYSGGQINPQVLQNGINDDKLSIVYDKTITEEQIVNYYLSMAEDFYIRVIFIDQYKSTLLKPALEAAGFTVVVTPTNMKVETMVSPILDKIFTQERLHVGNDSLFRWAVGNVYKKQLDTGVRFEKIEKNSRKTDPVSSLITGLIGLTLEETELPDMQFAGKVIE